MSKTIVLLDVDESIWFHKQSKHLNEELIERLKTLGATELFLFTDMTLSHEHVQHRLALIKILENLGFTVHGVITPSDILWNTKVFPTKFLAITIQEKAREYVNAVFTHNRLGVAFRAATDEITKQNFVDETITTKSIDIARIFVPYLSSRLKYSHIKGLLFEFFLTHLSDETKKVIVIDDQWSVIKSIREVCENKKIEFQTKKIQIDTVHIAKNKRGLYYSMAAALPMESLDKNHFHHAIIISTILREINRIQSATFCSKGNQQITLNLLHQLIDNLRDIECKTAIATELKKSSLIDTNFLTYVTNSINSDFNYDYSLVCQRSDVQKIINEISRLRYPSSSFFLENKKAKADYIENSLFAALKNGCDDVTQDMQLRHALGYHRIFSFWGLKNTTAILNVDHKTNQDARQFNF